MKISVIQSGQYFFYDPRGPRLPELPQMRAAHARTVEETFALMESDGAAGSDLFVTTEMMNLTVMYGDPRYDLADYAERPDGPLAERLARFANARSAYVVAGLLTLRDGKVFNSAVLFNRAGQIAGIYDKVHLTLGEAGITPGGSYPVFATDMGNLGLLICWDLQFPEAARESALGGADLIACPTWGWENRYGLCRAYENGVCIAAAMALPREGRMRAGTNPSSIVDSMGVPAAVGKWDAPCAVTAELDIRREPPMQYGNDTSVYRSMRHLRMSQRRPDTYRRTVEPHPALMERYGPGGG